MSAGPVLVIAPTDLAHFVPTLGAMAAVRAHHSGEIVLLTTALAAAFAASSPYFDEVWIDDTLDSHDPRRFAALRRKLHSKAFDRVYDFDRSDHSHLFFWLMYGWRAMPFKRASIPWWGAIPGTALAHNVPQHAAMHMVDRWAAELRTAGIHGVLRTDVSWVARQVTSFAVPFRMGEAFVLISVEPGPGSAWPAESYAELADILTAQGRRPVLVGFTPASPSAEAVMARCANAVDLTAKTSVSDLTFLTWAASAAMGPDNGIVHLAAAAGCPTVALFDFASDPALVGPRGDLVTVLRRPQLSEIPVGEVAGALHRERSSPQRARFGPLA